MEKLKSITVIFSLAVGLFTSAALAKPASVLLQEGLYAEEIEGDLDAAIEIYEQIIADESADESAAAQATYRIGMCYLKKGDQIKAAEQFRAVQSKFPKQGAVVTKADRELRKIRPVIGGPPMVVRTNPVAFADDVSPKLKTIKVTFDQPMMNLSWSWCGGGDTFPQMTGKPRYNSSKTTCSLPVKLEPGKVYWVGINSPRYKNFQTADGVPSVPYVILFATKDKDGNPTAIPENYLEEAKQINSRSKRKTEVQVGVEEKSEVSKANKLAAENLAIDGWRLWRERKFIEAEELFAKAVEKDPTNDNAYQGLGWSQLNQGKKLNAEDSFEKCIAVNPKNSAALNGLGWIAKGQGKTDEAIGYWEKAVDAAPSATAALNGLATTYMELKQYDKAAKYYQIWLNVEPNNTQASAGLEKAKAQRQPIPEAAVDSALA